MPDPIRVTRAVRRCDCFDGDIIVPGDTWSGHTTEPCPNCSDGWVDVPVDEECPTCAATLRPGRVWLGAHIDTERGMIGGWADCLDCDGSGRRLHNWATGWYPGDEILWDTTTVRLENMPMGNDPDGFLSTWQPTLVLSDPSHRPEPMRWKQ